MKELRFETGLVTYSLNGECEVSFNPTDSAFAEKLFNGFDELDKKQEAYKAEIERTTGSREIFEVARNMDAEMREIVDGVLGEGVSGAVFGGMNCYAMADGLPVWANLMLGIMDEISDAYDAEQKLTDPRIKKYRAKYQRR